MNNPPSANAIPDDLPLLTEVVERLDDLPILTEVIPETGTAVSVEEPAEPRIIGADILPAALQQRIEAHLEAVFAQRLAQLQQQAAGQALAEFKAALPELLREALNTLDSGRME